MPKIVSSSCFFNEISSEIQFFLHSTFQKIVLGTPWLLSPEVLDAQATSQQSRIHEFVYYDNINKDEKIVTARAPTGRILWVEDAAAADLWSAGCTLYAMLTGNFPFQPGAMIAGNMDKWHAKMSYAHARTKKPEIEFEETEISHRIKQHFEEMTDSKASDCLLSCNFGKWVNTVQTK